MTQEQAPTAPVAAPAPVRPRQVPAATRGIEDAFGDLQAALKHWLRSAAAYMIFNSALSGIRGTTPPDQRKRAVPLLTTNTTKFCEQDVDITIDVNKFQATDAECMLIPIINGQIPIIQEQLDNAFALLVELRTMQGLPPFPAAFTAPPAS